MIEPTFAIPPLAVDDTRPFWEFAAKGEFRMQACSSCGLTRWPPGPLCPSCWSEAHHWQEVARGASLKSWVVYRRRFFQEFDPPYVVALGEMDDGPRFVATLVGLDPQRLARGQRLTVVMRTSTSEVANIGRLQFPVFEEA